MLELYQMISAIVLTHNDEDVLERCIKSIQWCDEVIIIDDESTDGTIGIAKKYGAKVFVRKLNDDFAAQRNFGLAKAKGEWVLFVDSDEVVTEDLFHEIQEVISKSKIKNKKSKIQSKDKKWENDCVGYSVRRNDFFLGCWLKHGETGRVKLLRLARKDAGTWAQPVHEVWEVNGAVGELATPLLHYPHQNVAQFLEEINRYSTMYARYLHSRGVKEPMWQIIGKPLAKFFVNYIWRLGFLDGTTGMVVALMMSFHSFLVRAKLWQLHDAKKNRKI